jgi:hypothetical protein
MNFSKAGLDAAPRFGAAELMRDADADGFRHAPKGASE